jgi:uncharacterized OsmC-like protein
MNAEQLKAMQAPLKNQYKEQPASAFQTLKAEGTLDQGRIVCMVHTPRGDLDAGLHPAAGGDGTAICSGDMLLEALLGCAGVTLAAVATSMGITLKHATIRVEGDMDFRGTLGVSKDTEVGFTAIRMSIGIDTDASAESVDKLLQLTKRYCVVYQTLAKSPAMTTTWHKPAEQ